VEGWGGGLLGARAPEGGSNLANLADENMRAGCDVRCGASKNIHHAHNTHAHNTQPTALLLWFEGRRVPHSLRTT